MATTDTDIDMKQPAGVTQVASNSPAASDADEQLELALRNYVPGTDAEKKLVRKIDVFLVPVLWGMCVLCYLNRNNIGNANAAGMSKDLGLSSGDYAMLISIFFIAYLCFEVPSNLVITRVRPSLYVPALAVAWGTVCTCMSQVQSYGGILAARFFLGAVEAGFIPGVAYLFSQYYKKDELGKRFSIFFTALCFAGAAAGLLAGAIISGLEGARGMAGWRWLFLIEGIMSICYAVPAAFILLDFPADSKRLTLAERQLAVVRMAHDRRMTDTTVKRLSPLQSVTAAVRDLRTYFFSILYMLGNGSATINYFVPTVLRSMGYSGVLVQWMSVPIWTVGTVFLIVLPYTADRFRDRRWHITGAMALAFLSAIICFQVDHNPTRYAFLAFCIAGVAEKRAVSIAIANSVGNLSALYGSRLWPTEDAPQYAKGFTAIACFTGVGALLAAAGPIIFKYLPRFPTKAELEVVEGRAQAENGAGRV
ncbi:putative transporter [Cyphellophora attinorum]|uniref:Putative transporter n=1 Tax=Cyphellophora attinorum TaxID=1664694 RepID=A0A0N0NNU2_9EURO|nr:putative transporter [Phialophora attinorum]KPI41948.1 putative transporter [Phialophora attinorum]